MFPSNPAPASHGTLTRLILFVNDGSTDKTQAIIESIISQSPENRASSLILPQNQGKAEAVRQGIHWAFKNGYTNFGYYDSDLAAPVSELSRFLEIVDTTSEKIYLASRVQLLGYKIDRTPVRHYLGRVFATAASIYLNLKVYDTQCGLKFFKLHKNDIEIFSQPFISKWIFDVEILHRLLKASFSEATFREVPLLIWKDVKGSKVSIKTYFRALFDFIKLYLNR